VGITAGSRELPGRNACDRRHTYCITTIIIIIIHCSSSSSSSSSSICGGGGSGGGGGGGGSRMKWERKRRSTVLYFNCRMIQHMQGSSYWEGGKLIQQNSFNPMSKNLEILIIWQQKFFFLTFKNFSTETGRSQGHVQNSLQQFPYINN